MKKYLYERRWDKVYIYSLEASASKIYDFKKAEIEKLPENKRIFLAKSTCETLKPLETLNDSVEYNDIIWKGYIDGYKEEHTLQSDLNIEYLIREHKLALETFYRNYLYPERILSVNNSQDQDINFLLPIGRYQSCHYDIFFIESVINIPESLFLLNAFEKEKFDSLTESQIKQILDMYNYNGLEGEVDMQIAPIENLESQINRSKNVLRLLK